MLPVRCFTCNKVLANKGLTFEKLKTDGVPMEKIWEHLGLTRTCCRMIMVSNVDLTDQLMEYSDYAPSKYVEIRKRVEDTNLSAGSGATKVSAKVSAKPRVYEAV